MSRMYILNKVTYGDFDMPFNEAVAVSERKGALEGRRDELMAARSAEDLRRETHYKVEPKSVEVL